MLAPGGCRADFDVCQIERNSVMNAAANVSLKSLALVALLTLAACSSSGLPIGLTARMDQSGATLDRAEALSLINQFRRSRGVPALAEDPALSGTAAQMAQQYAASGTRPSAPENALQARYSAGYANFAETFSGWRGQAADAAAIADPSATRMGIAAAYNASSEYGVHWVLLLGGAAPALTSAPATAPAQ